MTASDFAQRQLEFLQSRGLGRDEALQRLATQLPSASIQALTSNPADALETHLRGFGAELGGGYNAVDSAIASVRRETELAFRPVWQSYRGVAVHFALVTALAWVLFGAVGIYVIPQFDAIYHQAGVELPAVTRFALSPLPRTLQLLLLSACAIALFWAPRRVGATIGLTRTSTHNWLSRLLLGRSLDEVWNLLELQVCAAAAQAGLTADAALNIAQRFTDRWLGPRAHAVSQREQMREQLAVAGRLGTLDAELDHQIYARLSVLPLRASARREVVGFAANILLGLVIGQLVIAIYLPIFKLAVII